MVLPSGFTLHSIRFICRFHWSTSVKIYLIDTYRERVLFLSLTLYINSELSRHLYSIQRRWQLEVFVCKHCEYEYEYVSMPIDKWMEWEWADWHIFEKCAGSLKLPNAVALSAAHLKPIQTHSHTYTHAHPSIYRSRRTHIYKFELFKPLFHLNLSPCGALKHFLSSLQLAKVIIVNIYDVAYFLNITKPIKIIAIKSKYCDC